MTQTRVDEVKVYCRECGIIEGPFDPPLKPGEEIYPYHCGCSLSPLLWGVEFFSEEEVIVRVPPELREYYRGAAYLHAGCWGKVVGEMRTTSNKVVLQCVQCGLRAISGKENEEEFSPNTEGDLAGSVLDV